MCIHTIRNKRLLTRNNSRSIRMVTLGTPGASSSNQNVKVQLQKACYVSRLYARLYTRSPRANIYIRNSLRYYSLFQTSVYAYLRLKPYNRFTIHAYLITVETSFCSFKTDIFANHRSILDKCIFLSFNQKKVINSEISSVFGRILYL